MRTHRITVALAALALAAGTAACGGGAPSADGLGDVKETGKAVAEAGAEAAETADELWGLLEQASEHTDLRSWGGSFASKSTEELSALVETTCQKATELDEEALASWLAESGLTLSETEAEALVDHALDTVCPAG